MGRSVPVPPMVLVRDRPCPSAFRAGSEGSSRCRPPGSRLVLEALRPVASGEAKGNTTKPRPASNPTSARRRCAVTRHRRLVSGLCSGDEKAGWRPPGSHRGRSDVPPASIASVELAPRERSPSSRATPSAPPVARRPHRRPADEAPHRAPRARAASTSRPCRTPPSTSTSASAPTAPATSAECARCRHCAVELPPAVVRDPDPGTPCGDDSARVVGPEHPLHHHRKPGALRQPADDVRSQVHRLLERTRWRPPPGPRWRAGGRSGTSSQTERRAALLAATTGVSAVRTTARAPAATARSSIAPR